MNVPNMNRPWIFLSPKLFFVSQLVDNLSSRHMCHASDNWLGQHSPVDKIKQSGLWQSQHLNSPGLTDKDMTVLSEYVDGM